MFEFLALAQECAPQVAPVTMAAISKVESDFKPFAIGVVGGHLARQPKSKKEAVVTAKKLLADGWNFSVGLAQINQSNFSKYDLTVEMAFDSCANLKVGATILTDCHQRAKQKFSDPQEALQAALSCYYSGNFERGFISDRLGTKSYVQKVMIAAASIDQAKPIAVVPTYKGKVRPQRVKAEKPKPRALPPLKPNLERLATESPLFGSSDAQASETPPSSPPTTPTDRSGSTLVFR